MKNMSWFNFVKEYQKNKPKEDIKRFALILHARMTFNELVFVKSIKLFCLITGIIFLKIDDSSYSRIFYSYAIQKVLIVIDIMLVLDILMYLFSKKDKKQIDLIWKDDNFRKVQNIKKNFFIIEDIIIPMQIILITKYSFNEDVIVFPMRIAALVMNIFIILYKKSRAMNGFLNIENKDGVLDKRLNVTYTLFTIVFYLIICLELKTQDLNKGFTFFKGISIILEIIFLEFLTLLPNYHFFSSQLLKLNLNLIIFLVHVGISIFKLTELARLLLFFMITFPIISKIYLIRIKNIYAFENLEKTIKRSSEFNSHISLLKIYELINLTLRDSSSLINSPLTKSKREFALKIESWIKNYKENCEYINCKCDVTGYLEISTRFTLDTTPRRLKIVLQIIKEMMENRINNQRDNHIFIAHYYYFLSNFLGSIIYPWITRINLPKPILSKDYFKYLMFHIEHQIYFNYLSKSYKLINIPNYNRENSNKKEKNLFQINKKSDINLSMKKILDYIHKINMVRKNMVKFLKKRVHILNLILSKNPKTGEIFQNVNKISIDYHTIKKLFCQIKHIAEENLPIYHFDLIIWYRINEDEFSIKILKKEWKIKLNKYFEKEFESEQINDLVQPYLENRGTVIINEFKKGNEIGEIIYCCNNIKIVVGHNKDQLIGNSIEKLLPGDLKIVHKDFLKAGEPYRQIFNLHKLRDVVIEDDKGWLRKADLKISFFPSTHKLLVCCTLIKQTNSENEFILSTDKLGQITGISKLCSDFFSINYKSVQKRKLNLSYLSDKFNILSSALNLKLALKTNKKLLSLLFDKIDISEIMRLKKKILNMIFKLSDSIYLEYRDPNRKATLLPSETMNNNDIADIEEMSPYGLDENKIEDEIVQGLFRIEIDQRIYPTLTIARYFEFKKISKSLNYYKEIMKKLQSSVLTTNMLSTMGTIESEEIIDPENHFIISIDKSICMIARKRKLKLPPELNFELPSSYEGLKKYQNLKFSSYPKWRQEFLIKENENLEKYIEKASNNYYNALFENENNKEDLDSIIRQDEYKFLKKKNDSYNLGKNKVGEVLFSNKNKNKKFIEKQERKKYYQKGFDLIYKKVDKKKSGTTIGSSVISEKYFDKKIEKIYKNLESSEKSKGIIICKLYLFSFIFISLIILAIILYSFYFNRFNVLELATASVFELEKNKINIFSFINLYQSFYIEKIENNYKENMNNILEEKINIFYNQQKEFMNPIYIQYILEVQEEENYKTSLKEEEMTSLIKLKNFDDVNIINVSKIFRAVLMVIYKQFLTSSFPNDLYKKALIQLIGPFLDKYKYLSLNLKEIIKTKIYQGYEIHLLYSLITYKIIFILVFISFWIYFFKKIKNLIEKQKNIFNSIKNFDKEELIKYSQEQIKFMEFLNTVKDISSTEYNAYFIVESIFKDNNKWKQNERNEMNNVPQFKQAVINKKKMLLEKTKNAFLKSKKGNNNHRIKRLNLILDHQIYKKIKNRLMIIFVILVIVVIMSSIVNIYIVYEKFVNDIKAEFDFGLGALKSLSMVNNLHININTLRLIKLGLIKSQDINPYSKDPENEIYNNFFQDVEDYKKTFKYQKENYKNIGQKFDKFMIHQLYLENYNICNLMEKSLQNDCISILQGSLQNGYIAFQSILVNKYISLLKIWRDTNKENFENIISNSRINESIIFTSRYLNSIFCKMINNDSHKIRKEGKNVIIIMILTEFSKFLVLLLLSILYFYLVKKMVYPVCKAHKNFLYHLPQSIISQSYQIKVYLKYYGSDNSEFLR